MTLNVDLYWSFRSPYSYLAVSRIVRLRELYDVFFNVRPVYPIAIRDPKFFKRMDPIWMRYLERDVLRLADYLGVPCTGWPDPDPVIHDLETNEIPKGQPYIFRLTRLGVEAAARGRGLEFINEVSHLLFGSRVKGWHEGDHLSQAAARAGLDLAELDAAIAGKGEEYDAIIGQNQDSLRASGHWGVPTMVFQNEPFFGQDRIEVLLWRLKQHGLDLHKNASTTTLA